MKQHGNQNNQKVNKMGKIVKYVLIYFHFC